MNLKKIELYGFKSFADRVCIDFESNITGIVGPNGCGKSNVADAVRWVLGEQSTTVLRCKKMTEVIFSGTTSRKSLSYCEVSLFLDNEKKFYPVDYDEVVLTRKLYRNGDSEYYINRTLCRLRDIIDLFRDSGVGRDGYSIIGQGKIEEILSAKPEARRQIFEEAAGISRHKASRNETERNLEKTRLNMERLNDTIVEIERTLSPLEEEAKNAFKARELKKKMKLIDVHYFLHQCENSSSERDRIKARLTTVANEISALENKLQETNKNYNIAMMDMANSDKYSNNLRDKITDQMVNAERRAGESKLFGERLNNLKKESQDISNENIQYEGRRQDRESEKAAKIVEFNELNAQILEKKASYDKILSEYEELSTAVDMEEKELQKSNELIFSSMDKLAEIDKNKAELLIERDILLDSMGSAKEEYSAKKARLDELIKNRTALTESLQDLLAEKTEKDKEKALAFQNYSDSLSELREAEQKKRQLENRESELQIKIRMLEDMRRDYSGYQDVVRRLMNEAQADSDIKRMILGTVGQVISVPKDLQLAIEISLGGSIQNIITANEYDASKLIDCLKQKGYGRATFMPIATVRANRLGREHERVLDEDGVVGLASDLIKFDRKFDDIISNLLGKTIIVDDKDIGISISKKYGYGFRIVTLDGVMFAQSGAITGGSAPSKNTRILSRESELEDLNKKLKVVTNDLKFITEDIETLKAENDELEKGTRLIDARIHLLDKEIANYNIRIDAVDSEAVIYKKEVNKFLSGSSENAARIKLLNELIEKAGKNTDNLKTERVNANDFVNEARDKFINDKQLRDQLSKKVTEALVALNATQNAIDSISKDLANNKAECALITQRLLDLRARKAINDKEIKDVEAQVDTTAFSHEDKAEIDRMRKEVADIEEHKKRLTSTVAELDTVKTEINKSLSESNEKRIREESSLERLDVDIVNLSERIKSDYDLDYDSARQFKATDTDADFVFELDKAVAESASLRRKIERMGPLNELAETKFTEEKTRYDKLKVQYEDLAKAEADLVKLIAQLTTEMTEKFAASFKQININFQEVFRELFNGGSAKLVLETNETTNILEAGIEIIAEPPGKKPSRISLLSGGERAMTAIAILFAIVKLKPMPFSILDEIEAALDEANADIFAQYLRKFSAMTQFIVVTHRKPTMALADMLYGVTNQEKGISTLVSVKLEDALKTAEEAK